MMRQVDPMTQRVLAQMLRYHVDQSSHGNTRHHVKQIRRLIEANPTSARSKHVMHNLGKARLAWLRERGLL